METLLSTRSIAASTPLNMTGHRDDQPERLDDMTVDHWVVAKELTPDWAGTVANVVDGKIRWSPWLMRAGQSTIHGMIDRAVTSAIRCAGTWINVLAGAGPVSDLTAGSMLDERWRRAPGSGIAGAAPDGIGWLALQGLPLLPMVDSLNVGWLSRTTVIMPTWQQSISAMEIGQIYAIVTSDTLPRPAGLAEVNCAPSDIYGIGTVYVGMRRPRSGEPHAGALSQDEHRHLRRAAYPEHTPDVTIIRHPDETLSVLADIDQLRGKHGLLQTTPADD